MKSSFVVKFAAVVLLAFGSFAQAQEVDTPTPDAVPAVEAAVESVPVAEVVQESVSDQVLPVDSVAAEAIAPVEPIVDSPALNQGLVIGTPSDCVGCGQVTPFMGTPVATMGMPMTTMTNGCPCNTGCNTCGTQTYMPSTSYVQQMSYAAPVQSGCNSCGTVAPVTYMQPVQSGCNSCGTVAQVTYQTPVMNQQLGSVVSAAPIVSSPTSVVTAAPAPVATPVYTQQYQSTGCAGCAANSVSTPMFNSTPVSSPVMNYASSAAPVMNYAPAMNSGCSTCGGGSVSYAAPAPAVSACNNCSSSRRFGSGRLLRSRR